MCRFILCSFGVLVPFLFFFLSFVFFHRHEIRRVRSIHPSSLLWKWWLPLLPLVLATTTNNQGSKGNHHHQQNAKLPTITQKTRLGFAYVLSQARKRNTAFGPMLPHPPKFVRILKKKKHALWSHKSSVPICRSLVRERRLSSTDRKSLPSFDATPPHPSSSGETLVEVRLQPAP